MADRASRTEVVTNLYLQILQQLNQHTVPQWLELDLTFQQMKVLYILKQAGPLKMKKLSERLKVSMPTITGIISRLVDRKQGEALVMRITSAEDRREVWAHLTGAGRVVTQQLDELNCKMLAAALAQLTDGEMEDARVGLNHIYLAMNDQQPLPSAPRIETVSAGLVGIISNEAEATTSVFISPVSILN